MPVINFSDRKRVPAVPELSGAEIFRFDSGAGLSIEDLFHHLLVLGSTGSGKTHSVAIPILSRLMESGFGGLIIDLKGNLRQHVRHLAWAAGCQDRIVEYGTGKFGRPINLLNGMSISEVRSFFDRLVADSFAAASHNMDFHTRGISVVVQCVRLLRFLHDAGAGIDVTVDLVAEMVNNERQAQCLYKHFKDHVYDSDDADQADFVDDVEGDAFSFFVKPKDYEDIADSRAEQLGYVLGNVKPALRRFLDTPGLAGKFCAPGCSGIDIESDIHARKIILLRFDPDTGPVGDDLARYFVSKFYEAIYNIKGSLEFPTFVLMDEYQEIADLGVSRFSDRRFVGMAREHRCAFIALTQSLAALETFWGAGGIEALVANCNLRVCFYSDDPHTRSMARRYGDYDLTTLESQQAFVVRYDVISRKHSAFLDTMNKSFAYGQERLALGASLEREPEVVEAHPGRDLKKVIQDMKTGEKGQASTETSETASDREECETMREIKARFPQFFNDDVEFTVPAGWKDRVISALAALDASGLPLVIDGIQAKRGFEVTASPGYELGRAFLNSLLASLSGYCVVCGQHVGRYHGGNMNLCNACCAKFGLADGDGTTPKKSHLFRDEDGCLDSWTDAPSM